MWHLRWTAKTHTRHKWSKEWKWRVYEGRKAIHREIKSAHWVSLLFIVVQGRTSIYLWTFYLPKQKRKSILWQFKVSKRYTWTSHSAEAKLFLGWNLREVSLVASLEDNWGMRQAVSFPASHNRPENIPHIKQDAPITQLSAASATGTGRLYFLSQRSMLTISWHWFWKEPANQKNGCKNIKSKWLKNENNLERWNATYSSFHSLLIYMF